MMRWLGCGFGTLLFALVCVEGARGAFAYRDLYTVGLPPGFNYFSVNENNLEGHRVAAGGQIVGWGGGPADGGSSHAVVWTTAAPNGIDLTPVAHVPARANSTNGIQQVGFGNIDTSWRAQRAW
jgi:hypothetical protein